MQRHFTEGDQSHDLGGQLDSAGPGHAVPCVGRDPGLREGVGAGRDLLAPAGRRLGPAARVRVGVGERTEVLVGGGTESRGEAVDVGEQLGDGAPFARRGPREVIIGDSVEQTGEAVGGREQVGPSVHDAHAPTASTIATGLAVQPPTPISLPSGSR